MERFKPTYSVKHWPPVGRMPCDDVTAASGLSLENACREMQDVRQHFRGVYIQVDPFTWPQFLRLKAHEFLNIPSEADMWAKARMTGGPMDTEKFAHYVESVGLDNANDVNRLMSRTLIGWYLSEFIHWLTRWNKSAYESTYSDQASDYYIDWKDENRFAHSSMAEYDADNGSHYAFDSRHDYDGNPHDYASEDLAYVDRVGGIKYGDHH